MDNLPKFDIESIRYAHGSGHTDICFGTDNWEVFSCGSDGYVRFWTDIGDDDSSSDFVAEQALSVACNEEYFFVATNSNFVQSYTYEDRKKDKIVLRFSAPVTHVFASKTSKFLAAGSCDMEIQVLEHKTNKIRTLTGHKGPILSVCIDPLDEYLVSSSCDGSVKIWDLKSDTAIKTFNDVVPVKNDFFKAVALGRCTWRGMSGSYLAIPQGLEIVVYSRHTWEESYRLSSKNIEKEVSAALFSPCGGYICGASVAGEVVIWEAAYQSEVCCHRDSKKIGISGIEWHSSGSKIAFGDRLGRMGILGGIEYAITKHVVPHEYIVRKEGVVVDPFLEDDDCDDNSTSLDKIKSSFMNLSDNDDDDDNSRPRSACSSVTERTMLPAKVQPAFQPSSTPSTFEPRCLCYNIIGMIRYYESDSTIDIQFHDTTFHHSLFLRSFGVCTMATLSYKVLCLAVPSIDDNLSKLTCVSLGSGARNKEWTVFMPKGENILAVAASGDWVAVATDANNLRIFSHAGTQKPVLALTGPIVCMSGHEDKLFITCHAGLGFSGSQNMNFTVYQISSLFVKVVMAPQPLPLSPRSELKWMGFTDEGTLCTYDSEGLVRFLGHDSIHWMVISDTKNQRKSSSDNYFIVGLNEMNQNIRCFLCRNSQYPLFINSPTIVEIPMRIPLCDIDEAKSSSENTFWRLLFGTQTMRKISLGGKELFDNFELPMQQAILKLFEDAVNHSDELRAIDVAKLMTKKALSVAFKYASSGNRTHLAEKLNALEPVDWNISFDTTETVISHINHLLNAAAEPNKQYTSDVINSQQDMFEDTIAAPEKENEENQSVHYQFSHFTPIKRGIPNPFKKPAAQPEDPKGLDYFDAVCKDAVTGNKTFSMNKPLKLKRTSNKEKAPEVKKMTFMEWFTTKKQVLSKENPDMSSSELAKMGTKLYREEMSQQSKENKMLDVVETEHSLSHCNKRSSTGDSESFSKRFRSLDEVP